MKLDQLPKDQLIDALESLYVLFDQKEESATDLGTRALAIDGKRLIVDYYRSLKNSDAKNGE